MKIKTTSDLKKLEKSDIEEAGTDSGSFCVQQELQTIKRNTHAEIVKLFCLDFVVCLIRNVSALLSRSLTSFESGKKNEYQDNV